MSGEELSLPADALLLFAPRHLLSVSTQQLAAALCSEHAASRHGSCLVLQAMDLLDEAGNPDNLTVHLDTYHMNIEESAMDHAIGICGDKLA